MYRKLVISRPDLVRCSMPGDRGPTLYLLQHWVMPSLDPLMSLYLQSLKSFLVWGLTTEWVQGPTIVLIARTETMREWIPYPFHRWMLQYLHYHQTVLLQRSRQSPGGHLKLKLAAYQRLLSEHSANTCPRWSVGKFLWLDMRQVRTVCMWLHNQVPRNLQQRIKKLMIE